MSVFDAFLLLETGGMISLEDESGDILLESAEAFQASSVQWIDAFGNPFPAGVEISLVDQNNNPAGSGFTTAGGSANLDVQENETYTATFIGIQGPNLPFTFTVTQTPVVVQVPFYASPTMNAEGYADADPRGQTNLYVRNWFGDAPPIVTALATGIATALAALDSLNQEVLGEGRSQSSVGLEIASWANDFIGAGNWSPGEGESDPAYLARVYLWLQSNFTTLYALQTLVQAYLNLSPNPPAVYAFDWQSDPTSASEAGLNQYEGQFCLSFTFPGQPALPSWFLGQAFLPNPEGGGGGSNDLTYLGVGSFNPYTPPAAVQRIVQLVKACGTKPIYTSNLSS